MKRLLGVAFVLWMASAPVMAQESALKFVPADAPVVVVSKNPVLLEKRLKTMLENAVPDMAGKLLEQAKGTIFALATGRKLDSIDSTRPMTLALLELESLGSEDRSIALYVPVKDVKAFKEQFFTDNEKETFKDMKGFDSFEVHEMEAYLVPKEGYAVLTTDKDFAKELLEKVDAYDAKFSAGLKKAVSDTDVGVLVNLKEINELYGAQIRQIRGLIDLAALQGGAGVDKSQIEMVKAIYDGFVQALSEGDTLLLGFQFRPEGLSMRLQAVFKEGSSLIKTIKKFEGNDLKSLATLPAGQMSYSAAQFPKEFTKFVGMMVGQAIPSADSESKAVKEALDLLEQAGLKSSISSMDMPSKGVTLLSYGDPKKAAAAMLKLFESAAETGEIQNIPLDGKPTIKAKAEKVGDIEFSSVSMKLDFEKAMQDVPEQMREAMKNTMTRMMGEKVNTWFGATDKDVIQVTAKDWKEAKNLLEKFLASKEQVGDQLAFQIARKNLPEKAAYLSLSETTRLTSIMYDSMKMGLSAVPGFGGNLPMIEFKDAKPSYVGIALTAIDGEVVGEMFIPAAGVQQVRKVIAPLLEQDD